MKKFILPFLLFCGLISVNGQEGRSARLENLEQNQPGLQDPERTATLKRSSRLFGEKDDLTSVLFIIPSGSTVEILDSDSTYLYIFYDENEGYIFKRDADIHQAPLQPARNVQTQRPQQEVSPAQQARQQPQQQDVSRFSYLESKYGSSTAARIMSGKIWKGMSTEMVRDSWGSPQKINRVISSNRIKEEWIFSNTWLYIENNTLIEWGARRR